MPTCQKSGVDPGCMMPDSGKTMDQSAWWATSLESLLVELETRSTGLTDQEAEARRPKQPQDFLRTTGNGDLPLLMSQFRSPITLLLIAASVLSLLLNDQSDAVAILVIVLASVSLGFWQERMASHTVARLLNLIRAETTVIRNGAPQTIAAESAVKGDVIDLIAGSSIPADCRLLEAKDLHLDEATLTGETFPVEKQPGTASADAPLTHRANVVYLGTHVVSGTGRAVVVAIGPETEFGRISERLRLRSPETEFERGIRRFGYFLIQLTLVFVLVIFAINVLLHKPVVESLLFALALAVGLTPQLLPAIVTVNLTHGTRRMANRQVIVRRLAAIENFGSMDVLCSDKTGTLTEGRIEIQGAVDPQGINSERVRQYAYWNASYQTGLGNPIDDAIRADVPANLPVCKKLDEVPYDFVRRRLSVLIEQDDRRLLITKGAVANILEACDWVDAANSRVPINQLRQELNARYEDLSRSGCRTLGVAYRDLENHRTATRADEVAMTFAGFLVLHDPPKADSAQVVAELRSHGIRLKMISGDNRWVARNVARLVGLAADKLLTGADLRQMSDTALMHQVTMIDVFAEVEPIQKERILLALKKAGHVVGYLGDGINDATALHAADVGISVDSAVDVAKDAADIVLMRRDLSVLVDGIESGRETFANTLKYVFLATSANFGNMFSMAGASLFLPYLPLLPQQILLGNLLTDFCAMTIASDAVDPEDLAIPRRWNIKRIRNFMIVFGLLSSVFDYLTFAILLWFLRVNMLEFRTGWFVESLCSATLIVLVVRTRRPFFLSRPGTPLMVMSGVIGLGSLLLPWLPMVDKLGFTRLPASVLIGIALIVAAYIGSAELAKRFYYAKSRANRPGEK